jgi:hypothetical protein
LTTPEGNFGSALEDVLHLDVRFTHTDIEVVIGGFRRQKGLLVNTPLKEVWRYSERNVRHIGAIPKDVSLAEAQFHVEVVFVTQTEPATNAIWYFKVEVATAAIAVELKTGPDVHVEREVAGERFQEGLIQHRSWRFAWAFFAIRIGKDTGIQDRTAVCIRLEGLHLGFHSLDALLVLSLHLVHLRLERTYVSLIRALSEKRVSG